MVAHAHHRSQVSVNLENQLLTRVKNYHSLFLSFFLGAVIIIGVCEVRQSASSSNSAQLVLDTLNQVNCDPFKQVIACFKRWYRTFDGTCNNLCKVAQGSAGSKFVRFVPPAFQNGQGPRFASVVQPFLLENARTLSNTVFLSTSANAGAAPNFTHMTMAWGSFIDHDFTLTASNQTQGCGTNNEPCPTNNPGCVSISISQANPDDRLRNNLSAQCIPLSRSAQHYGEQVCLLCFFLTKIQNFKIVTFFVRLTSRTWASLVLNIGFEQAT